MDDPTHIGGTSRDGILDRPLSFWALFAFASVCGAWLRLHDLGLPSFWVDEFFTIARSGADELSWTQVVGYGPTKISLWLYGADLDRISLDNIVEWQSLGVNERAARLGACWVGIATIPVVALLARPVAGGGAAGVGALLIALTPWHIYWSQMARFYTTKFLFSSIFVLVFARAIQTGSRRSFAVAAAAALLAYLSHPTAIFVVGACGAIVGLAWITRAPFPNAGASLATLALILVVSGVLLIANSLSSAGTFSGQTWDPPLHIVLLGMVQRIEPVTVVVALGAAWIAVRRRDPVGILLTSVALLVPLCFFVLKGVFPIAPRYLFPCLLGWALLAAQWSVEVDRSLSRSVDRLASLTGVAALLVTVSFSAYLYSRDGTGARTRWGEAYALVSQHADATARVFVSSGSGLFQAQYYLGREALPVGALGTDLALAPGDWVVERSRGSRPPTLGDQLDLEGRFEIPSKPWSWVLTVMRVPAP